MNIAELDDDAIELAYPAMKQLRTDLGSAAELIERVREQRAVGYRLVASVDPSGAVVSVAGFRYAQSLCCGRHVCIAFRQTSTPLADADPAQLTPSEGVDGECGPSRCRGRSR